MAWSVLAGSTQEVGGLREFVILAGKEQSEASSSIIAQETTVI